MRCNRWKIVGRQGSTQTIATVSSARTNTIVQITTHRMNTMKMITMSMMNTNYQITRVIFTKARPIYERIIK